jgi:hypothetical protein
MLIFKKLRVIDFCRCDVDGGWSFALTIDDVSMDGWFDPEYKILKLWNRGVEIVLDGDNAIAIGNCLTYYLTKIDANVNNVIEFKYV